MSLSKVCITLPLGYSILNPAFQGVFGGSEVRLVLVARELAKRSNFEVHMVVGDFGQPHKEVIDGVHLWTWNTRNIWSGQIEQLRNPIKLFFYRARRALIPFTDMLFSKPFAAIGSYQIPYRFVSVYDEIDADIYMVPGNSVYSAEVASYCARRNKKYVFVAGSDFDYRVEYKDNPTGADIYKTPHSLKIYSIEQAHAHIVQQQRQAKMLLDGYGRNSIVIKNPIDLHRKHAKNSKARTVLWVGKSDERVKRPSIVLELARRLPHFDFVIILNFATPVVHAQLLAKARELPNVELVERVPADQIEYYFANARVHINTSRFEGFPNTFLQAAKYGVPTVSMNVDPGNMLYEHQAGLLSQNIDQFEENVRKLMENDALCSELGNKAKKYVKVNHDKELIIQQYEDTLLEILKQDRL
jgi:glycosyltransferase involved in cell wall biosynthesis